MKIGEGAASIDFASIYRGQVRAQLVKSMKVDMERVHSLQPPSEGGVRMGKSPAAISYKEHSIIDLYRGSARRNWCCSVDREDGEQPRIQFSPYVGEYPTP